MATSIEFENVSGAAEGASAAGTVQLAQAEGVSPQQPAAQADPVPVDAGSGQPLQPAQPTAAAPAQAEYVADASNVVHLPANVAIDNIKVDGENLVLEQPDGSVIVIKDAASNVPTFLLGDVEVPRVALIAALEAGGINVAFGADGSISAAPGSASSSGGNFELPAGGIGNGFDLSALLPPTALAFPQYDGRELTIGENADPEFAGFSIRLSEEGLQGGLGDNTGSPDDRSNSPVYTGQFGATDPNGDSLTYSLGLPTTPGLTSGGQPITWELVGPNLLVGKVDGGEGPDQEVIRLEITDPGTGAFEVRILGPIDHPEQGAEDVVGIDVPVTVKDPNGGSATANVTIEVEDDSPEIRSVGLGGSATVDETTAGTPAGYPVEATSQGPVLNVNALFGADGAAAGGGISYALSLTGAASSLKTAIGDFPISLVQVDPTTIAGVYQNGEQTAFTVKINANGTVTVTQNVPLEHITDGPAPADHDDFLSLSGLVNATVTITDFDNDSVLGGAQIGGLIRFYDDGPSVSPNETVLLDDDAFGGNPGGTGDDDISASLTGTLGLDFGADGGSVAWLVSGAPAGFEYKPGADGALEVFQNGTKVLTVTLNSATGAYTVTQNAPILHAAGGNENNQGFTLTYRVTDNDGDTADGTLQISVDDDTPTIVSNGEGEVLTVDETTLGTNATASFANNFVTSYGADGPGSVTYALSVVAGNSGLVDTATGQQVVLSLNNGVVEGRTATGNTLVFTVKVDANGEVTLDQIRSVRHPDTNNHDDSRSLAEDLVKLTATITDKDGDSNSATLNIGDNLVFKDDGPSVRPGDASVKVDEDDLLTALSHGTSPDGDTEWFTGAAKVSGSVAGLVSFGADGAAAGGGFGFTATVVDQMRELGLQSKGSPLSYAVVGNTLVAFVDNGNGQYDLLQDRPVFTMTLQGDGDFTFRLLDQLDHVDPVSGADQNEDLQAAGGGSVPSIDFGSVIQATDRDGDSVTLAGKVNVTVRDDVPEASLWTTGKSAVHDETMGLQKGNDGDDTDRTSVVARFASLGQPSAIGYAHQNEVVEFSVRQGADDSAQVSLTLAINGGNGTDSGLRTTSGSQISLYLVDGLIVGRVDNADGSANPNGQIAFAVALDQDGGVSIAQYLSLEHPTPGSSHDEPVNLGNLVNVVLKVTDNDGDTVERSVTIGNKIVFEDDGPRITAPVAGAGVVHDETPGNDPDANDAGTISPLSVANPGSDPHVNGGVGPIGVAQSQGAIVTANVNYGADGAGGLTYALDIGSASTTLRTTEGRVIQLFNEGGIIVGRFDAAGGAIDQGDPAAFAVGIDPATGVVTLVQYVSLQHPTDGASHDEDLSLAADNITVVLTATDGDDDTTSATVNVGNLIKFQDDGPKLTVTAPQSVANGLFFDGFTGNNGAWGTGSGTATGNAAGWKIEASETGGAGTVVLEKVGEGYLGADSPTDSVMVDLEASPGNIQISQTISGLTAGESYGLSFEIGAANGTAAGSAIIEVIWNGQVVGVYQPTPGSLQTIVINVPGVAGDNTLTFREIGTSGDNTGTYLANVKLNDIIVIDETAGIDPASDEVSAAGVSGLFAGVNAGADLDMSAQYAQGTGSVVGAVPAFGADGPAASNALTYALELASENGVNSGLTTTEGNQIFLYKDASGRIIGVYDADGNGVSSTDQVAFALHVDPATGVMTIAQYVSLDHPDTSSHDEGITLAANTVSVRVTATDGDGDTATGSADISGRVLFEDDGPRLISVVPTVPALGAELIQNGSFETGHGLTGSNWEIFAQIDGWTTGANGVPFEIQTGGAGGMGGVNGSNAVVELDGDTQGNGSPQGAPQSVTNATIQQVVAGTEAGQAYQLTFHYSPRGDAATAGMKVTFGGVEVFNSATGSYAPGSWYTITVNVTAPVNGAVLAFTGTGSQDEIGALLDNVSLKAVYTGTIDDENVPEGATGIPGGPGDDGAGNVATGKINFDAGSDGLKSIEATLANLGLQGIHVAGGVGTAYAITTEWVAGQNGAGNTAGFEKGGTLVGTMDVGGGQLVPAFTLEIRSDGSYTLTMLTPLNHPGHGETGSFEDNIELGFGFTITDGDDDTVTGNIAFNVDDDSPVAVATPPAAKVMEEPGSSQTTVQEVTYSFGPGINVPPVIPNMSTTGMIVVHDAGEFTLQSGGGGQQMVFTASGGTTFTVEGAKVGLSGANTGPSQVTLIGYDAAGNEIPTHVTITVQSNAIPGVKPTTVISLVGTALEDVPLSKLVIAPPSTSNFMGWIIVDDLSVGHVTVVPATSTTSSIDLSPLVSFGEDGAHAGGAFQLKSFVAQDFAAINSGGKEVQIVSDGTTLTGFTSDNAKVFELQIVNGKAVLTLYAPLDHGDASHLNLDFSQFITARDGDGDAIGLGQKAVVFSVKEGNVVPTAGEASAAVDDDGLSGANTAAATGDIDANANETPLDPSEAVYLGTLPGAGGNGALVFSFAGMHNQPGQVGQEAVTYAWDADTNTLTANGPRGPLFTVEITDTATGAYKVTLLDNVLHASGGNEASVSVDPALSYTVGDTDANNTPADTATGTLKIEFNDDVPTASHSVAAPTLDDEAQPFGLTPDVAPGDTNNPEATKFASGQLDVTPGADGLASVEFSAHVVASDENGVTVPLQAIYVDPNTRVATTEAISTSWTPNANGGGTLIGTSTHYPSGTPAFVLTVDKNGAYTFTLNAPLSHPLTDAPAEGVQTAYEDDLKLSFNYTATDSDGDTASATLTVKIDDDTLTIGTPASIEVGNGAGTTTGTFDIQSGADGIKDIDFTSLPANLKSGGLAIQYAEVGNKLIAHTGDQADPVFTLTVNPAGGYVYQSFKPLDGTTAVVDATKASGAYGSGPGTAYILTSAGGAPLAVVSGWKADGTLDQVKGAAVGWGVGTNGNLEAGEMLRFDFQDADNFGADGFTPPAFAGPAVTEATLSLKNLAGDTVKFVVHYTDGTQAAPETVTISGSTKPFTAPAGKFIDYIEVTGVNISNGGGAKVSLSSVSRLETTVDLDLQFGIKVVDGDGDSQSAIINIGITDTKPQILDLKAAVDGGDAMVDEDDLSSGSDTPKDSLTATGSFKVQAGDGIDDLKVGGHDVIVNGVFQAGVSFTTPLGGTLAFTGYNAGVVSYTYTLNGNQSHATGDGENDRFESFGVVLTDVDGDSDAATLSVRIVDDVPTATIEASQTLAEGGTATGKFDFVGGADGATVTQIGGTALTFGVGGWSQAVNLGNGTIKVQADGTYEFTANNSVDNTGGAVPVTGTFTVRDADGDTSEAGFSFQVTDKNTPTGGLASASVDDDGLSGNGASTAGDLDANAGDAGPNTTEAIYQGNLGYSFGGDGAGSFAFNTGSLPTTVGQETVGYAWANNVLTATTTSGTRLGTVLFTVTVTPATGAYTVELKNNILHASLDEQPGDNTENELTLNLGYTVRDADGSPAGGTLAITFDDDAPTVALSAAAPTVTEGSTLTGSWSQAIGADSVGAVAKVVVAGVEHSINSPITVSGLGTLTVNGNGTWSFAALNNLDNDPVPSVNFSVKVTDGDGDTATANVSFQVTDKNTPTGGSASASVDDDGLSGGNSASTAGDLNANAGESPASSSEAIYNGSLGYSFGGDGAGSFAFNTGSLPTTVGQETVSYGWSNNVLTATTIGGTRAGTVLFTVTVTPATGAYTVELKNNILHATGANTENELTLNLGYTVRDADGSPAGGTLAITFDDDMPTVDIAGGNGTIVEGAAQPVTGSWTMNTGADGVPLSKFTISIDGGAPQALIWSGGKHEIVVDGKGTLTLTSNGGWSFAADQQVGADTSLKFKLSATDNDGDVVSDEQTISIKNASDVFVVGSSSDDKTGGNPDHTVRDPGGLPDGAVIGGAGNDILIGDPGTVTVGGGQKANIVLVLDSSGSMDSTISFGGNNIMRMTALKNAVVALLDTLSDSGADQVRVNIVEFWGSARSLGVFDIVLGGAESAQRLADAKAAVNGLQIGGGTNYEAGLAQALSWISSAGASAPIANADLSKVLFVSDGQPTSWNNDSGGGSSFSEITRAVNEMLGSDGSNEPQQIINKGWSIDAVGIALGTTATREDFDYSSEYDALSGGGSVAARILYNEDGVQIAQVSAWTSGNLVSIYSTGSESSRIFGVNGNGIGVGEILRFDFGLGTDYDGNGNYSTGDFNGTPVTSARFDFREFGGGQSSTVQFTIRYTDGTQEVRNEVFNGNNRNDVDIPAAAGKFIDYIEFSVTSTEQAGYIRLDSVLRPTPIQMLDLVEGNGGQAVNVTTAEQLTHVIGNLGGSTALAPAGDDTIQGGAGNDLIFGDALFTDTLAAARGLSLPAGSGWKVFETLEASPGWTRADTLEYIRTHQAELAGESGRGGGDDIINGGAGNDVIFGQEGDDVINGGSGADTMTGGSGADTFVISADALGAINDIITDFNPGEGDQIDLSELLKGLSAGTNLETGGYVKIEQSGTDSIVSVDQNGGGNSYQQVAVLENFSYDSSGVNDLVKVLYENSSGNKNPDNV